jgi:hypothetical protein
MLEVITKMKPGAIINRLRDLRGCEFIRTQAVDDANKFAPTVRSTVFSRINALGSRLRGNDETELTLLLLK